MLVLSVNLLFAPGDTFRKDCATSLEKRSRTNMNDQGQCEPILPRMGRTDFRNDFPRFYVKLLGQHAIGGVLNDRYSPAWEIHNDNGIYMINDRVQFALKRNNLTYTRADDEYHSAAPRGLC
jgi:hypothetical protein